MKIVLGADHRGIDVGRHLLNWFSQSEHEVIDVSGHADRPTDYPDVAYAVGHRVAAGSADLGVLVGGTGIGMAIAANKIAGIRAALVHDEIGAEMSRRHNDANVLCLAADMLGLRIIDSIMQKWLVIEFEKGRHERRVRKLASIERGHAPAGVADSVALSD